MICSVIMGWWIISIHALREEGDSTRMSLFCAVLIFLSTPSARRATPGLGIWSFTTKISIHALREEGDLETLVDKWGINISIHALREEGDSKLVIVFQCHTHFYPRPPRGGRRERGRLSGSSERFLSTPSARRATSTEMVFLA